MPLALRQYRDCFRNPSKLMEVRSPCLSDQSDLMADDLIPIEGKSKVPLMVWEALLQTGKEYQDGIWARWIFCFKFQYFLHVNISAGNYRIVSLLSLTH